MFCLSQGCREKHDGFIPKPRDWSAFRSTDYGYTRMHLINSTHIYLEQVSDDQVIQSIKQLSAVSPVPKTSTHLVINQKLFYI